MGNEIIRDSMRKYISKLEVNKEFDITIKEIYYE